MKDRVLFVDDEPRVLEATRRMLRPMRDQWDMTFVDSGEKALEVIRAAPPDVVVSDIRMPGMDGAVLLEEVCRVAPGTVRIVLSGYAEEGTVFRTVGPAHQYLAKPCRGEVLSGSIARALALRELLNDPALRKLVAGMGRIPTAPRYFADLLRELNSRNGSAAKVAEIISHDVAMSATIMKMTNSAFFSLPTAVTSPLQAVRLLGMDTIKSLALVAGVFSQLGNAPEMASSFETLSRRSLFIGALAKAIAEAEKAPPHEIEQAFCAGCLAHVGTLLLMANAGAKFKSAAQTADSGKREIAAVEKEILGASHAEIGAYLLGLWGFTNPIVEAVAYHHKPQNCASGGMTPLLYVHVAQELARIAKPDGGDFDPTAARFNFDCLKAAGIEARLPAWREIAIEIKKKGGEE